MCIVAVYSCVGIWAFPGRAASSPLAACRTRTAETKRALPKPSPRMKPWPCTATQWYVGSCVLSNCSGVAVILSCAVSYLTGCFDLPKRLFAGEHFQQRHQRGGSPAAGLGDAHPGHGSPADGHRDPLDAYVLACAVIRNCWCRQGLPRYGSFVCV